MTPKRWLLLALGVSCLFYLLLLSRCPVGYLMDDAFYILAAKSLLQGRYVNLALPDTPSLTDPLPGFPLFIAPFVAAVGSRWFLLKGISLLLTLLNAGLLWKVLRPLMKAGPAVLVVALYAFNPTTVTLSGILASEPFFLFLILCLFAWMPALLQKDNPKMALLFGGLLGWAMLVRPQGIVLWAALGISLYHARKRGLAIWVLGPSALLWICFLIRNYIQTRSATAYLTHWGATLPVLIKHPDLLGTQIIKVVQTFLGGTVLSMDVTVGLLLTGCLVLRGAVLAYRRSESPVLMNAMLLFVFFYFGLHLFWSAIDERYLYPILPFILMWLVMGLQKFPLQVCLLVLLGRYVYADTSAVIDARHRSFSLPQQTYGWIREQLPSHSLLFTPALASARLYADRYALYVYAPGDLEEFRYFLIKRGVTHLLAQSADLLSFKHYQGIALDANARWERIENWVAGWPGAFPAIYRNSDEKTVLYSVPADPRFLDAYEQYRHALAALEQGRTSDARRQLQAVLQRDPALPGALNALGMVLFLSDGNLDQAEQLFRRAVSVRPDYALAWVNLARLERRQSHPKVALEALGRAWEIIDRTGEWEHLRPVIEEQRQLLGS